MAPDIDDRDPLDMLANWLSAARQRIHRQLNVRTQKRASGTQTEIRIDHRMPCDLDLFPDWHIQTLPTFLPRVHFASYAGAKIKSAARHGRAIYCHDSSAQEVTAALSYHLDQRTHLPILITALGFRTDTCGSALMRRRTLSAALVLRHHLHAISAALERGGHVDIDLHNIDDELEMAHDLGFRPAPRIRGFRPAGTHLRQSAPS